MSSRIWSDILSQYVGEVQDTGRVWSDRGSSYVGEVQESGRVWSDRASKYVGEVQGSGRVWSDEESAYIGEVQESGKIWSTEASRYVGEVSPPNLHHGGAALLLLLPTQERRRVEPRPRPDDDEETNWVGVIFGLIVGVTIAVIFAIWRYRYVRALFFIYVAVVLQFGAYAALLSSGLHFLLAALAAALVSVPLYRFSISALRWRAKDGPRVNAWVVTGVLAALTLGGDIFFATNAATWQRQQFATPRSAPAEEPAPADAPSDPAAATPTFTVEFYEPPSPLTANQDGVAYRSEPFEGAEVLGYSVSGEALNVSGRTYQSDGAWYQLQLSDGRVAYAREDIATDAAATAPPEPSAESETVPRDGPPGWLGVSVGAVTEEAARAAGTLRGALITRVVPSGPASAAGLMPGDVVVSFNGDPIDSSRVLTERTGTLRPGDRANLEALRAGRLHRFSIVMGSRPVETPPEATAPAAAFVATGVWRGTMDESGRHYDLVAEFYTASDGSPAARISYVELECGGDWRSEPGVTGRWRFRERITVNPLRCTDNGFVDLIPMNDGSLLFEYRRRLGGTISVSGILRPATNRGRQARPSQGPQGTQAQPATPTP